MTNPEDCEDVHSVYRTPGHYWIDSGLLRLELDSKREEFDAGIVIHQDGKDVAIGVGSVDTAEDDPTLKAYHRLSIEEARELATDIQEAADEAQAVMEDNQKDVSSPTIPGEIIRRWIHESD